MVSAYARQSRLMPFDYAEQVTRLPAALLRKLVRDGVVPGEAPFCVQGLVGYCDIEAAQRIAEELKAARAGLEGQAIRPAEAKVPLHIIQKYLRHANLQTTLIYASADQQLVDEIHQQIDLSNVLLRQALELQDSEECLS